MKNELTLFDFQNDAIHFLIEKSSSLLSKKTIVLKSPTGSGKTIMLISYIDEYLSRIDNNIVFVWLTPGRGNLEEQSQRKMKRHTPNNKTGDIQDILLQGFDQGTTYFVNWEMITNKRNNALKDTERKNLFDRITEAHRSNLNFIVIIDEEHLNNTSKANDILNSLSPVHEIRISATTKKANNVEFYEVEESRVISSGLITKALYINEGIDDPELSGIESESSFLLELADNKRREIKQAYLDEGEDINPLVIIQFPDSSDRLIKHVEEKLSKLGYSYENRLLSKWLSDDKDKINITDISLNNATPVFLIMKQAISTGWDAPRAKILIKLRENMTETFEIQTLGRIRRMPNAKHYEDETLNYCHLFTFDEKYKETVIQAGNAYEIQRLFLKPKFKDFELVKEIRNNEYEYVNEQDVLNSAYSYLTKKYDLTTDKNKNKTQMENFGYVFGLNITSKYKKGRYQNISDVVDKSIGSEGKISYEVNTHDHGLEVLHSVNNIKKEIGLPTNKTRAILQHLFNSIVKSRKKILNLSNREWYAFMINNSEKLKEDFIELVVLPKEIQLQMLPFKIEKFAFPKEDFFRYLPYEQRVEELTKNVYQNYNTSMISSEFRSSSEQLFEYYINENNNVDWYYKNGDSGHNYLSIIYGTNINKEYLFYPDYILKMKNNDIWIIETKGGETSGKSKNIDKQSANKFNALKQYSVKNNLKWGFVRDRNNRLYINNTVYVEEMNNDNWINLEEKI